MDWLIIGLGNPGPEYEFTPHNLGFLVVDRLAVRHRMMVTRPECKSLAGVGRIGSADVVVAKPQTYMNLSGSSVKPLLDKLELGADRLIVVYDDLDLPWPSLRIRPKGSAGGHHGMESLIKHLGTNEFARVRLGVDPGHPVKDNVDYLLTPLKSGLRKDMDPLLDLACEAVETIIADGVEKAMTKFNRRAGGVNEEK
jgi:peptidyl-tRNA hydrolase, PTH1 family